MLHSSPSSSSDTHSIAAKLYRNQNPVSDGSEMYADHERAVAEETRTNNTLFRDKFVKALNISSLEIKGTPPPDYMWLIVQRMSERLDKDIAERKASR